MRLELKSSQIVWLFGVSQIIGYGTLYYSFSILADDIAKSFSWPVSWVYGSFSLALLAGGVIAPLVGRRIDRHGAAAVMALGSALSSATLLAAAVAPNPIVFTIALTAMQAASALVLYDAAFAALVQATGHQARLRITHLTLIAGFSSTLFWPLTSWLHGVLDWRQILIAFAAINILVCLPIHLLIARSPHPEVLPAVSEAESAVATRAAVRTPDLQRRLLWLVTLGFALSGFALSAVLTQMVPMLTALGLGSSALLVSTLFGPAQVLVRFANMLLGVGRHPISATLVGLSMLPLALLVLLTSAPLVAGAVAFALLLGFGSGLKSVVQGTLPLALFGNASYGARLGIIASARQVLGAVAPFSLAFLIGTFGATFALAAIACVAVMGLSALLIVAQLTRTPRLVESLPLAGRGQGWGS